MKMNNIFVYFISAMIILLFIILLLNFKRKNIFNSIRKGDSSNCSKIRVFLIFGLILIFVTTLASAKTLNLNEDSNFSNLKNDSFNYNNVTNDTRDKLILEEWIKDKGDKNNKNLEKYSYKYDSEILEQFAKKKYEIINRSDIEAIELNYYGKAMIEESVPWIDVDYVHSLDYTGDGVDVCVIDSGIKSGWEGVFDNIENEYCYCDHSPLPGGCCPNGETTDTNSEDNGNGHGTLSAGIVGNKYKRESC